MDLRAYIEKRSIPIPFTGCWLWLLSTGSHGYGQAFTPPHGVTTAHRVSYRAFRGPIPAGLLVQHKCDQRWCVNLELGTDKTNCDDKVRKGRDRREKKIGQIPSNRKLTVDQIAKIRSSHEDQRAIAARFGVTQPQIGKILRGEAYKNVAVDVYHTPFSVGAKVTWETNNYGACHAKTGVVVEVIAAGGVPLILPPETRGVPRRYTSYVIESRTEKKAGGQRLRRFWPIASLLKLVTH